MKKIIAVIVALVAAITFATPATASTTMDRSDQEYVTDFMNYWYVQASYSNIDTICEWFLYDRRDFYRTSYREIWAEDGISYYDMRVGLYRALKPLC